MRDLHILIVHLSTTVFQLARPRGLRAVVVLPRHQLLEGLDLRLILDGTSPRNAEKLKTKDLSSVRNPYTAQSS
jgi:hypothetical protein